LDCLSKIADYPAGDKRLLYACALDGKELKNTLLTLRSLEMILDQVETQPENHQLPVLLRCILRLYTGETESSKNPQAAVESLCLVYERGEGTISNSNCESFADTN
jgi:hypothetical protein